MFFVSLHKRYRGNNDEVLIRGDLILEVSTRRHGKKAAEYATPTDPPLEPGAETGAWVLVDRIGWTPCVETPAQVAEAILAAEVEYRRRLEAAKAPLSSR